MMRIIVAVLAIVVHTPVDASAQVRRGRALEPDAPPWAPIAIGVRFGYDQEARGEVFGGGIRIPLVRNGLVEFNPNMDVIFLSGADEYSYNLDMSYIPGGARGGLVLGGGLGWRDSTLGEGNGKTFFGYNLIIGGKTNLGPLQIELLLRWAFLTNTQYEPNIVSLGLNYPLWRVPPPR